MARRLVSLATRVALLALAFFIAFGAFTAARELGWLSPIGIESESHDSQVIHAIERTQEVSLVALAIEGIKDQDENGTIFGWDVPGTSKVVFLQYSFTAKLGVDGAEVKVSREGAHTYNIAIPQFILIGFGEPHFDTATEDGGILSGITPDIDKTAMINEILDDAADDKYIDDHKDLLEDQTKVFYDSLITGIDPDAVTKYEFSR